MDWLGLRFAAEPPAGDGFLLLTCTHNTWLILVAYLVASGAGYCAFDVAERMASSRRRETRWRWCWLSACCLGGGVWAMHFIAMLAFEAPIKISYDVPTTALSLLVVLAASLLGMLPLATPRLRLHHFVSSTLAIVIGLTAMHYLGVAAMRSEATIYYEPTHFLLSVAIAVGSGLVTVLLFTFFRRHDAARTLLKLPAGLALGGVFTTLHMSGIQAMSLLAPSSSVLRIDAADNTLQLGLTIGLIAGLAILGATGVIWADKQLRGKEEDLLRVNGLLNELDQIRVRLQQLAHYDGLTNLLNRRAFNEVIAERLRSHAWRKQAMAVIFLDVDHFKRINDSLGHDAGDELLKVVAERVQELLRRDDVIARLGGDEFCVLATVDYDEEARTLSQRILQRMKEPITLAGRQVMMTTSIGISLFPEHGETSEELLKHADLALYQAKDSGRDNLYFFSRHLKLKACVDLQLEEELHHALERDQGLQLYYQPILDLHSRQVTKLEALVRWQHPQLGMLSPDRFIRIAEANGFIAKLDAWVMRRACQDMATLSIQGFSELRVAVNCSALNLSRDDLADDILQTLQTAGIPPYRLELEVTENALMSNINQALTLLAEIRGLGVTISIDDFGTGYSSLAYLKRLPLDTLKIDRSFVQDIPHSHADMEIVQAIIGMARTLHLKVVAEGVETCEQLDFLRSQGCDFIQGYLLSKPQPLTVLIDFLRCHEAQSMEGPGLRLATADAGSA